MPPASKSFKKQLVNTWLMPRRAVLGLTEQVIIYGPKQKRSVRARIDTGATKSSIDTNLAKKLELGPVIKRKKVKSVHGMTVRPFIFVKVKIKGKELEGEFNLAEREHMTYPVLIGQSLLKKGKFLVDPLK